MENALKSSNSKNQQQQQQDLLLFKPFTNRWLLSGSLYSVREFYGLKRVLFKYDDEDRDDEHSNKQYSEDYVNYGYWKDGVTTRNPSRELVLHVASKLNLRPSDTVLDIGSGMGQPDVDLVSSYQVRRIIGVNSSPEQVDYCNRKFRALQLDSVIQHRLLDAHHIDASFTKTEEQINQVIAVESFGEIPRIEQVVEQAYNLLTPGGGLVFCDQVNKARLTSGTQRTMSNWFKDIAATFLLAISAYIYGDQWRSEEDLVNSMKRAGFSDVAVEHIGAYVYPSLYRYSQIGWSRLRNDPSIPRVMRYLASLNLSSVHTLYQWGMIDYVVVHGTKSPSLSKAD